MSIVNSITSAFVPIHKEGYRFIAIFAGITLFLFWLEVETLGWIGVVATAWCAYFFRDPERVTPLRTGLGDFTCRWPHQLHRKSHSTP